MWRSRLREIGQEPLVALAGMSFAALMLLAATDAPAGGAPADEAERTPSAGVATAAKVYTPRLVLRAASLAAPSSACGAVRVGLGASGRRDDGSEVAGT